LVVNGSTYLVLVDAGNDNEHLRIYRAVWNDTAAKRTGILDLHKRIVTFYSINSELIKALTM